MYKRKLLLNIFQGCYLPLLSTEGAVELPFSYQLVAVV